MLWYIKITSRFFGTEDNQYVQWYVVLYLLSFRFLVEELESNQLRPRGFVLP